MKAAGAVAKLLSGAVEAGRGIPLADPRQLPYGRRQWMGDSRGSWEGDTLVVDTTVTRPFSAAIPMRNSAFPIFEYACHGGNYGLLNVLRGARAEELGGDPR